MFVECALRRVRWAINSHYIGSGLWPLGLVLGSRCGQHFCAHYINMRVERRTLNVQPSYPELYDNALPRCARNICARLSFFAPVSLITMNTCTYKMEYLFYAQVVTPVRSIMRFSAGTCNRGRLRKLRCKHCLSWPGKLGTQPRCVPRCVHTFARRRRRFEDE